jgi:PAS domain S-box-containing protein
VCEANITLINHAVRALIEDAKDAFIVIDTNGTICFVNRKAAKLTGKYESQLVGTHIKTIIIPEKGVDLPSCQEIHIKAQIKTSKTPVEVYVTPITNKELKGAILTVRGRKFDYIRSLEALGPLIQRYSSAQQIYETLGKELRPLDINLIEFCYQGKIFTMGYHTLRNKKTWLTEFIARTSLSEIKLTITENVFNKIIKQKSLFFRDLFSFMESATPNNATADLSQFFTSIGISKGVIVPTMHGDKVTGLLGFFSEEFTLEDTPTISALGVHISAALERAHHYEQLVTDLKALEEQISARTQELMTVKTQMETIVQSSADAILATDLNGYVTFVNKGVTTMFGSPKAEIMGQSITAYYAGERKKVKKLKSLVLKQGRIENAELDFQVKNGRLIHTMTSFSLLKNGNEITGIMAVIRDVTEQKKIQKMLESLNKAAFQIQKCRTIQEIFTVTAEELRQLNYHVGFMLFNEKKTIGRIMYVTAKEELKKLEDMGGKKIEEYEFSLNKKIFKILIKKKEAVYIPDLQTTLELLIPSRFRDMSEKALDLLGITNKKSILAPLVIHGETAGLLSVTSDAVTVNDIPPIMALANQVSTALENARLLEESMNRAEKLAQSLTEQQILRELNTNLFFAQSQDEVLDAAIGGIHALGKPFSNISMINEERTYAKAVRLEIEPHLLAIVEEIGKKIVPGFTMAEYLVPVGESPIYHQFFESHVPLISSNIAIEERSVMRADLNDLYTGFASKDSVVQHIINAINPLLPYQSVMVFPIVVGGHTIGCITVVSNDIFSEMDFTMMKTVGEMVSSAMERIAHSEKLAETLRELRAVQHINTLLNMGAPLEQILVQISTSIENVYNYQFAYPLLLDSSKRYLTFNHVVVPPALGKKIRSVLGVDLEHFKYPVAEDAVFYTTVIKEKKCLIRKGFEEMAEKIPIVPISSALKPISSELSTLLGLEPHENSVMVAPLPYGEDVIGVLLLGHKNPLTEEDFQRLEYFLDQVGIAMAKSEAEYRLRQSLQELKELDQMKSEFIDIASHELRTPLTTLKLYLEMMDMEQYGKLPPSMKERIQFMKEGVNRLEDIINQTLVASRLIKNKLRLEKESISLMEISTEVVRQLSPLWKSKNQNIFLESFPDLSDVVGDREALFTVMSNLVDNAIRYSPERTEIFIKFVEHPVEVECMVCDQGCGIPAEHIDKVFEEFYIVPSETEYARMDGRTGLGLFIAKGIVEQHKGKVWVESALGEGSTFHVVLPKKEK